MRRRKQEAVYQTPRRHSQVRYGGRRVVRPAKLRPRRRKRTTYWCEPMLLVRRRSVRARQKVQPLFLGVRTTAVMQPFRLRRIVADVKAGMERPARAWERVGERRREMTRRQNWNIIGP